MADLSIPEEELARYFEVDEEASTPTRPKLRLNPETVEIPPDTPEGRARSAQLLNSANFIARLRREARYQQIVASGQYRGPLIAAEGDSWFQYPFRLKDVIDWTFETYAVYCRSEAGDTLENMLRRGEYLDALDRTGGRVLLLSGGGNDLVAGGNLAQHLRPFDPRLQPAQYLLPSFGAVLDGAIRCIESIVRSAGRAFPACRVVCHGYDYAVPNGGNWLGRPMASRGITDPGLQKAIAREMVDRLNTRMINLANQTPRIAFVDMRGTVGDGRWFDELHPTDEGYGLVTRKIVAKVSELTAGSREAPMPGGDSATASLRARRRARCPTQPQAAAARGYSLHVGLNLVDPASYEGWDGELTACEFDAEDMANLSASVGYEAKVLKTTEATREAVIGEIKAAAARMNPGDIFFLTYSGHGSQVPDFSGDERLERPEDAVDETLCLYDGQIVDDELYALWAAFPKDSRVLAVFDCCHSGSAVKGQLIDDMIATAQSPGPGAARDPARHRRPGRAQAPGLLPRRSPRRSPPPGPGPVTREMALPVAASVRLVSACQDNQVALDGLTNGLFTGKLLETWGAGAFQGDYAGFHKAIVDLMPPTQTPNHYTTGLGSPSFDVQRPFDI